MTNKEKLRLLYFNSVLHNDDPNFIMEQTSYLEDLIKELEILEILKKHIYYSTKSRCIRMQDIYKKTTSFDYEDLKEWLEK